MDKKRYIIVHPLDDEEEIKVGTNLGRMKFTLFTKLIFGGLRAYTITMIAIILYQICKIKIP